jgi:hypothetical protein
MKRILFFGSLVVIALGVITYFFFPPQTLPTSSENQPASSTPFGSPAGSVSGTNTNASSTALLLQLQDGSQVSTPNFIEENQPPSANAVSGYQVAGSNTSDFQILYFPQNFGILISLLTEPIGTVRLTAESALRAKLGLSDSQLCKLIIDVGTTADVNSTYAGRNLGLSFCPGSVTLPK